MDVENSSARGSAKGRTADPVAREVRGRGHLRLYLLVEGLAIGVLVGLVITAYRLGIAMTGKLLQGLLSEAGQSAGSLAAYIGLMAVFGVLAGLCYKLAPLISGSGIPQVSAQLAGRLRVRWQNVLPFKFLGGLLTLGGGLTLGREGPSVQIGAAVGQGFAELGRRPFTERKFLVSSGAAAGLAAAFNAPIAGAVFALEELHRNFSPVVLVSATAAAFAAVFTAGSVLGIHPVLLVKGRGILPLGYYGLLVALGIVTGLSGVLFNRCILWGKSLYARLRLHWAWCGLLPFALTAAACLLCGELFGSGEPMIFYAMGENPSPVVLIGLYAAKLALLALCFGSGLPGGIFFPLLVLGSLVGNVFGQAAVSAGLMEPQYVSSLALMAMTGHFSAIVRSPLTGILLISEMTGSFAFMLPLGLVAMTAYVVAESFRSEPIYESLQKRLLSSSSAVPGHDGHGGRSASPRDRMLVEFGVENLSPADGRTIAEILWPEDSLVIAVKRGSGEIVPSGQVRLMAGDYLVVLIPRAAMREAQELLENLTKGSGGNTARP